MDKKLLMIINSKTTMTDKISQLRFRTYFIKNTILLHGTVVTNN